MLAFVDFTTIFKQSDVKWIGEDKRRFGFGDSLSGSSCNAGFRQKRRYIFQSHISFRVFLKSQAHNTRFFLFYHDCLCSRIIEISHWRLARKYSHSHFLAKSAFRIFGKRIYIVFALPESHVEHEFTLTSVITPKGWKFNARKFPCVEKINNLSAVHRIAGEPIGIPCKDVSAESFNFFHHLVKQRTTWNFGRLFFYDFGGNFNIFPNGVFPQFGELSINRKNLLVLDISGLASIQKEFFIFHIIIHSDKKLFLYPKQILLVKIASDFAPASWRKNNPSRRRRESEFV